MNLDIKAPTASHITGKDVTVEVGVLATSGLIAASGSLAVSGPSIAAIRAGPLYHLEAEDGSNTSEAAQIAACCDAFG